MMETNDCTEILPNEPSNPSLCINVGPEINCDNVDRIQTKDHYICFNCNKKNPVVLTMSNTFSFVFGTLLDNMYCCITSASQRALMAAVLSVILLGAATTGGIVGKYQQYQVRKIFHLSS